ncbi:MAG: hypothetical protein H0W19_04820, partial [Nitrosopumilus sp.]|nr:hypothetical protein [Nitrosopumilus sp.]
MHFKNFKIDIKYINSLNKAPYKVISLFAFINITFMVILCSTIDFSAAQFFGHNIDLSNNKKSFDPQIAVSGNNVFVVWRDDSTGKGEINFKKSVNNGENFTFTKKLSNNEGMSSDPQIAASGNNVYVAWRDETTGNGDIYF